MRDAEIQNYVLRWLVSATARALSIFLAEKMRAPKNIILNYFVCKLLLKEKLMLEFCGKRKVENSILKEKRAKILIK